MNWTTSLVMIAALGCGSSPNPEPARPAVAVKDDPTCPVLVAGTSVTVEDTDAGAALVFVTTGDVAAVRTRTRALADAHNARHAAMVAPAPAAPDAHAGHAGHAGSASHDGGGGDHTGHTGHGGGGTMGTMISTHSTAAMTELPNGARITFTAHEAAAIQAELRMHAQHLAGGTCVM